jgi:hypothetical protein
MKLTNGNSREDAVGHQAKNGASTPRRFHANPPQVPHDAAAESSQLRANEKMQLINGTWHFFCGRHLLDLKCGPRQKPHVVSREQAALRCAERIEAFRRECNAEE